MVLAPLTLGEMAIEFVAKKDVLPFSEYLHKMRPGGPTGLLGATNVSRFDLAMKTLYLGPLNDQV